jgi:nitrogen fixation NifU-like protein
MPYSDKVLDHFNNPRNIGSLDKNDPDVGTGVVGAPECGDVMKLQIKVDENGVISEAKFKTFGCGAAIAASSLATEWLKGRTVDEARELKNTVLAQELALPPVKIHCSVLAEDAVKAAIMDWKQKNGLLGTETEPDASQQSTGGDVPRSESTSDVSGRGRDADGAGRRPVRVVNPGSG